MLMLMAAAATSTTVRRAKAYHSFLDHTGLLHQEPVESDVKGFSCPTLALMTPTPRRALPAIPRITPISPAEVETKGREFEPRKPSVETAAPTAITSHAPSATIFFRPIPACQTPVTTSTLPSDARK